MALASGSHSGILLGIRTSPIVILTAALAIALLATGISLYLVASQSWLGVKLGLDASGEIVVEAVQRADIPIQITPGDRLRAIGAPGGEPGGEPVALQPLDVVEEPDTLETYDLLNTFRSRQEALSNILALPVVSLHLQNAEGQPYQVAVSPADGRALSSLPPEYWVQIAVGVTGVLIGAWILALRRRDTSAFYLFLTGLGLMISALAASIYTTRELAIQGELFRVLGGANALGTYSFGAALICLFLYYPNRIVPRGVPLLIWTVSLIWIVANQFQLFPSQAAGTYGLMAIDFALIGICIAIQIYLSRKDPLARAALGWFGLFVLCGTGVFVFAIAAPLLLGLEPGMSQGQAFGIILLIYVGLALGVARYRLFDLGAWAFRLGTYFLGALLLIGLDAFLIYGVAIERAPAFGIALLTVALVYLPVRDYLGRRLRGGEALNSNRFRQIVDIALTRAGEEQTGEWHRLLGDYFNPLTIETTDWSAPAALVDDGLGLIIPGHRTLQPLKLCYAHGGRRLFSQQDAERAQELVDLMRHALDSRDAHEQGVKQERGRIARDLHDNIGAQLLRTLHSNDAQRKDAIVGETLADLREIISNAQGHGIGLEEILAELRFETDERLALAGLHLEWTAGCSPATAVSAGLAHTLRSIIREAASNTIRHARATRLKIEITERPNRIDLLIADDGVGFPDETLQSSRGLNNISLRTLTHGGSVAISGRDGARIEASFPMERSAVNG